MKLLLIKNDHESQYVYMKGCNRFTVIKQSMKIKKMNEFSRNKIYTNHCIKYIQIKFDQRLMVNKLLKYMKKVLMLNLIDVTDK